MIDTSLWSKAFSTDLHNIMRFRKSFNLSTIFTSLRHAFLMLSGIICARVKLVFPFVPVNMQMDVESSKPKFESQLCLKPCTRLPALELVVCEKFSYGFRLAAVLRNVFFLTADTSFKIAPNFWSINSVELVIPVKGAVSKINKWLSGRWRSREVGSDGHQNKKYNPKVIDSELYDIIANQLQKPL